MLVQGLTFLSPLGNQVFITAGNQTKADYMAHGFGWMNDGSLAVDTSNIPNGASVSYNKGFAFNNKGAVYATATQSSTDVYIEGIRVSAKGALVLDSNLADTYHSGNALILDGCLASSVPGTTGPTGPLVLDPPAQLLQATTGVPYTVVFTLSGGTPPYQWAGGTTGVPNWLIYQGMGNSPYTTMTYTGIPDRTGTYSFLVYGGDSVSGYSINRTYSLTVVGINVSLLGDTQQYEGQPATITFTATGGTPPYTWTILSSFQGPLPTWMTLSGNTWSGTPPQGTTGEYWLNFKATDSTGISCAQVTNLVVYPARPLTITYPDSSLPLYDVNVDSFANYGTFSAYGGFSPYTWSVDDPNWTVDGNPDTGNGVYISGTPTEVGSYGFTVTVTDNIGISTSAYYSYNVV